MTICVTGSNGLIGSSVSELFLKQHTVIGIDNDMRKTFFGEEGSTLSQKNHLSANAHYIHNNIDIRNKQAIRDLFNSTPIDIVVHCAAQPSHDRAKDLINVDFEVNTLGTLNLLEAAYLSNPKTIFIFTSTNKVYGDNPNKVPLTEGKTSYRFKNAGFRGFDEQTPVDNCTHSFFGASKLAADIYVQEYGRYLGLRSAVLRLGCVTGAHHAGVKLHGFLSYLIKTLVHKKQYEIIGYGGKQVRDQIHADDVARACEYIIQKPVTGEVFNLGGGKSNSASIIELITLISHKLRIRPSLISTLTPRVGDHVCYITDTTKFRTYYPNWKLSRSLDSIVDELISYEQIQTRN